MFDLKLKWYDFILIIFFAHPLLTILWGMILGVIFWELGGWLISNVDISWK